MDLPVDPQDSQISRPGYDLTKLEPSVEGEEVGVYLETELDGEGVEEGAWFS